jgi:hypothetical protein
MNIHLGNHLPKNFLGSPLTCRLIFGVLFWIVLGGISCSAADKEWAEVRSPHFRVITDGSEKDARRVAREFEQIRFAMSFGLSQTAPGLRRSLAGDLPAR